MLNPYVRDDPIRLYPPLKTNMSPENRWLEDVFPTKRGPFSGDMGHVSFQGCNMFQMAWLKPPTRFFRIFFEVSRGVLEANSDV